MPQLKAPRRRSPSQAPPPPVLERAGVRYFRSRAGAALPSASDAVHFLNPQERAGLTRVQRGAIIRSSIAGALSSLAAALAELWASPLLPPEGTPAGWMEQAQFWAVVGTVTVVAAVLEIAFLYWDALRSVHRLAKVAGLELFPQGSAEGPAVASALARAALELPNPSYQVYGVDPHREVSRFRLLAASVAYKLKVSITNFAVKALVRRMLGRAAVRTFLPFVAVPLTAAWNGAVTWMVLRESRLRAMGPSAARELVGRVLGAGEGLSDAGKVAAMRAVASAIVRSRDLHPNLLAVLREVKERCGSFEEPEVDDTSRFLAMLPLLPAPERQIALRILAVACIIDGKLTFAERRLYQDALSAAGLPQGLTALKRLLRAFVQGEALDEEILQGLGG